MTTNKNVLRVLNGYLELSPDEKILLRKEIDDSIIAGVVTSPYANAIRKTTVQAQLKSHLGPTNDNFCKCCGK